MGDRRLRTGGAPARRHAHGKPDRARRRRAGVPTRHALERDREPQRELHGHLVRLPRPGECHRRGGQNLIMGRSRIVDRIPRPLRMGCIRTICLSGLVALASVPAALADTTQSTNWAGYAAHGSRASFRAARGSWIEPSASCVRGVRTYSSYWVGIGGYSETSQDLEQIGTEVDCTASGRVNSTAWYELVPSPSAPDARSRSSRVTRCRRRSRSTATPLR